MNQSERKLEQLLLSRGYTPEEILYQPGKSPDFVTSDGKGWEAKRLYGEKIIFYPRQRAKLQEAGVTVLVFHDGSDEPMAEIPGTGLSQTSYGRIRFHDAPSAARQSTKAWRVSVRSIVRRGFYDVLEALDRSGLLSFTDLQEVVENPRTLSLRLSELRDLGLIRKEQSKYGLTKEGIDAGDLLRELDLVLRLKDLKRWLRREGFDRLPRTTYRGLLRRYVRLLLEHFEDRLVSVVVFGSVAQGDDTVNESDIDLLVVVDEWGRDVWGRIEELSRLKSALEETAEHRLLVRGGVWPILQHYPLTKEEAQGFHRIYLDMLFDGITLYDREDFMEKTLEILAGRLEELGSRRVQLPGGGWYWILKPDLKMGEEIEIQLY